MTGAIALSHTLYIFGAAIPRSFRNKHPVHGRVGVMVSMCALLLVDD
jgi:hypothetical protein